MIPAARPAIALLVCIFLTACASTHTTSSQPPIEATSLLGQPLYRPQLSDDQRSRFTANLARAKWVFDSDPTNEMNIIWYARRLGYLGRYNEAIDVLTHGFASHPDSIKILRHRGHRYITTRQLDKAIADLSRAAHLVETRNIPDAVEPDGMPNKLNQPTSTTNSNIYYHLGLAHYLKHDYHNARRTFMKCRKYSSYSEDMDIATAYWLYFSIRRSNNSIGAANFLATVPLADLIIIENHAYHDLLTKFAGQPVPDLLIESEDSINNATIAYGLANFDYCEGRTARAIQRLEAIVAGPSWPAFGYIAAESDLAHLRAQQAESHRPDGYEETARRVHDVAR